MPDPAFAHLVLARSVTTVDECDDLEAKKAERRLKRASVTSRPIRKSKAVEFTVRRLLCGFSLPKMARC
jgi:hypothetical protein